LRHSARAGCRVGEARFAEPFDESARNSNAPKRADLASRFSDLAPLVHDIAAFRQKRHIIAHKIGDG
jgi:hypothetical protein